MEFASPPNSRPTLMGRRHMIVSGQPLASMAGMRVLEAGGNAIDAGVAAGFALNVLQPDMANLGGVAPVMLYLAGERRVTTFSGVGRWAQSVTRAKMVAVGNGRIPVGPARWVVPAAVDSWLAALGRYGTMSAAEVLGPAIALAADGFPLNYFLRANLEIMQKRRMDAPHNHAVFLPDGVVPDIGSLVRQTALAETLRHLVAAEARAGGTRAEGVRAARDAFYKGDIAEQVGKFAAEVGSFLTAADLRAYEGREEQPVSITYRGQTVHACGPWTQGPAVLRMLNLMEGFDPATLPPAERAHLAIECAKIALLDRNRYYGDPDFVDVPMENLLSKSYADARRAEIGTQAREASPERAGARSPDTTYVCVADAAGNLFSATPSDSTILISPMVPGLGFGVSDRGLQASLIDGDPNVIAPGKRPRLTPNPGIVVGADFAMPYGTPGGEIQTQAMLQFLINHLDLGLDPQAAAEAPRWSCMAVPATEDPHPATPGRVYLETRADPAMAEALRARGHDVQDWPDYAALAGGICAIRRDARTGVLAGGADPRRMAYGIGW